jgi:hypothetical protein
MLEFIQEATLPKLSQTSLFIKFNESSELTKHMISEINSKDNRVSPEKIPEIISLIKLNGDAIAKKAIAAVEKGEIIITNNKETSQIPLSLPFVVLSKDGKSRAFIFAQVVVDNIQSSNEYTKLMAVIEAAYLALQLQQKPDKFVMNRQLMLSFCNLYCDMVTAPLEQKIYVKGENLTKMRLFAMAYFYRMIDGDMFDISTLPSIAKRVVLDKVDNSTIKEVGEAVKALPNLDFMASFMPLLKNINPIRYKDLDVMYMNYFVSTSGTALIFALENLQYLFLLLTSSAYKTGITGYGLNKSVAIISKKAIALLSSSV